MWGHNKKEAIYNLRGEFSSENQKTTLNKAFVLDF